MKKYIKTVTVTGASDDTSIKGMEDIQARFPFVEWGILFSRKMAGKSNRFPSEDWFVDLKDCVQNHGLRLNLAAHLCGQLVNVFLNQKCSGSSLLSDPSAWISYLIEDSVFNRVQINTHGERHKYDLEAIESYLKFAPNVEFITQFDNVNDYIFELEHAGYTNISALYDLSHGAGVLPEGWHKPLSGIFTGYAGGLSPDNLEEQLQKLDNIVNEPIWIDAETWLRTDDLFDLEKVVKFLEIAKSRVIL